MNWPRWMAGYPSTINDFPNNKPNKENPAQAGFFFALRLAKRTG